MATVTHAARSRSRPADGGAAVSTARKAAARPKAHWAFDGGGAVDGGAGVAVQAKMEVSQPGDMLEREADRVAAHVVGRSPAVGSVARGSVREDEPMAHVQRMATPAIKEEEIGARIQRLPQSAAQVRAADLVDDREESPPRVARAAAEEETKKAHRMAMGAMGAMGDEDQKKVHRRVDDDSEAKVHRDAAPEPFGGMAADDGIDTAEEDKGRSAGAGAAAPVAQTPFEEGLRFERMKGGVPLPRPLRDLLEPAMRANFDGVRVHIGDAAATLARSVRARAFTVGRHIFFGSGQFQPQTQQGQKLVAHEVTHVLQQRGGLHSVQREILGGPAGPSSAESQAEKDEDAAAEASPDSISFAQLMRIFNLREGVTPRDVMVIIRELLENVLRVLPKAEKLLPFVVPALARDRTVRRYLRSETHELRLEATRMTEGPAARQARAIGTEWELRFLDRTREPARGGRAPGGTDEDAIGVETGRPREPPAPGADLKAKIADAPAPAAPAPVPVAEAAPAPAKGAAAEPGPIEAAAATPGGPEAGAVSAAAKEATAAAEEKIPSSPEEDPNFQAVAAGAKKAGQQSATHGEAGPTARQRRERRAGRRGGEKAARAGPAGRQDERPGGARVHRRPVHQGPREAGRGQHARDAGEGAQLQA